MKKRFVMVLLSFLLTFSLVACSGESSTPPQDNKGTNTTENKKNVTVVDHLDRTITIEKEPERIISGYYISTSAIIALGLEDKLVGIEAKAETRPIYSLAEPKLLDLPNVGTAKEFDLEGCISLNPDLVILPIKLKDQIKTLEDLGITVIGVNPENQELLVEMITMIAQLTGIERHQELIAYYEEKENQLIEFPNNKDNPRVYLAGNSNLLSTATKKMYQNDLIEGAGGVNVAGNIEDSYWANISYEQLVQYNPEYIIIVPEAKYTKEDVLNDKNISGISAIQNNRVYQMPKKFEAWDSPVPSSILGKMWLTSILYREEYPYDKFVEEVAAFYYEFYDFSVDKEALQD